MSSDGSVTHWIPALKSGDSVAAQEIWQRYYDRLVALARKRLIGSGRRQADEEDVVQNAFNSFYQGVSKDRFPQIEDRDDLWRLLVVITARKALDQLAYERAKRRGGGTKSGETRITTLEAECDDPAILELVGPEPTPEFAAQLAEQYEQLLLQLEDATLQRVAVWKMEGFTNTEIAAKMGISLRTVARKLETIRIIWKKEPMP